MADFLVKHVTDGDTFKVEPAWDLKGKTGDIVRPVGYDAPERNESGYKEAKQKLTDLILNKTVDVRDYKTVGKWRRLIAKVYYNGRDLADYFPEFRC